MIRTIYLLGPMDHVQLVYNLVFVPSTIGGQPTAKHHQYNMVHREDFLCLGNNSNS